ncbi:uncharacterized protein LOC135082729 [Ostrinia nubilalis]|uniref:uncharacterized protein LOC135082729 n=1 Tax=Ostrinia nubilalis TaxID=29057 RepID=UPI0030825F1A
MRTKFSKDESISIIREEMVINIPKRILQDPPVDYIGSDFQGLLFPITALQKIFMLSKFRIHQNIISSNSTTYTIVSFIFLFSYIVLYLIDIQNSMPFVILINNQFVFIVISNITLQVMGIVLIFFVNLLHDVNNNHVIIIKKVHYAYRIINCISYISMNSFKLCNWIYVFVIYLSNIFIPSINYLAVNDTSTDTTILLYMASLSYFDMNMLYAIRILNLMRIGLAKWILEVRFYAKLNVMFSDYEIGVNSVLLWEKLQDAYMNIVEAFSIFEKVFEVPVRINKFVTK